MDLLIAFCAGAASVLGFVTHQRLTLREQKDTRDVLDYVKLQGGTAPQHPHLDCPCMKCEEMREDMERDERLALERHKENYPLAT